MDLDIGEKNIKNDLIWNMRNIKREGSKITNFTHLSNSYFEIKKIDNNVNTNRPSNRL